MAKSVKIIPASKEQSPAKETLRAAAYCCVSTACEEQMGSLEAQQQFYALFDIIFPKNFIYWLTSNIAYYRKAEQSYVTCIYLHNKYSNKTCSLSKSLESHKCFSV